MKKWVKDLTRHLTKDANTASKPMKRCSLSSATREVLVKTTGYHSTPTRTTVCRALSIASSRSTWSSRKSGWGMGNARWRQSLWKTGWQLLPFQTCPHYTIWQVYSLEFTPVSWKPMSMWNLHVDVDSSLIQNWRQPRCPAMGEWTELWSHLYSNMLLVIKEMTQKYVEET